jgi:biotin operon repressor
MEHEKYQIDSSTGEQKLVNANFIQVYKDNIDLLERVTREHPKALEIFWWITKRMDNNNALVVSQQSLAEALKVSRMTIHRAVEYLKENKVLDILKSGNSNIYALNSKIVWQDDAENKKYAHFTAKVYVTAEEQDIDYQTQLFGHAVKKSPKKRKISPEEAFKGFERANPRQKVENAVESLKQTKNAPLEVENWVKKGYKFIEETENAYELESPEGVLTQISK